MAPSVKIVGGIDCTSGTSFEAALGMLEDPIMFCKSKKDSNSLKTNLSSKSHQPPIKIKLKLLDLKDENIKDKKSKKKSSKPHKQEYFVEKKSSHRSKHDKENSDQSGHGKEKNPVKEKGSRSKAEDKKNQRIKELENRNEETSEKSMSKSHKDRELKLQKQTAIDYKSDNKSMKKNSHKDRDYRKRHRDSSLKRKAKKQKRSEKKHKKDDTQEVTNNNSDNYDQYSIRDPSGKINFERLVESGTVSIADAMELLLDSVPEIADVSVNNQRRHEPLSRINATKHNQNKLYAGNKSIPTKVPSLANICNAFFQDNLSLIGYTGGVPYSVLKPILEVAPPGQLYRIEFNNQYLINGQTDELWQLHCQKDLAFKTKLCWESYRDMYIRYEMERLTKLGVLGGHTTNQQDGS